MADAARGEELIMGLGDGMYKTLFDRNVAKGPSALISGALEREYCEMRVWRGRDVVILVGLMLLDKVIKTCKP
jgi:hypothetical protein